MLHGRKAVFLLPAEAILIFVYPAGWICVKWNRTGAPLYTSRTAGVLKSYSR